MASNTTHYNLVKPAPTDFYNIQDFNDNADTIDAALAAKPDKVPNAVSGNFVSFSANGLADSGKKPEDYLPAGTTAADIGAATSEALAELSETQNAHANNSAKHLSTEEKAKLGKAMTTDNIVVSGTQPAAVNGRIWIKI